MRSDEEMRGLICGVAVADERVRAVVLSGSRADGDTPADCFQDYDVVYFVRELDSFLAAPGWVDVFGPRVIMQTPMAVELFPQEPALAGWYTYLMLFCDGNRIDLMLAPVGDVARYLRQEPVSLPLLDKDGLLAGMAPPPGPRLEQPPTPKMYDDCCNEFWWVATYVAKGLWRGQLAYAWDHLDTIVRPMLVKLLGWKAVLAAGRGLPLGKSAKYLQRYVDEADWRALLATWQAGDAEGCWRALFACAALFDRVAREVAELPGYACDAGQAQRVAAYLRAVHGAGPGECPEFENV